MARLLAKRGPLEPHVPPNSGSIAKHSIFFRSFEIWSVMPGTCSVSFEVRLAFPMESWYINSSRDLLSEKISPMKSMFRSAFKEESSNEDACVYWSRYLPTDMISLSRLLRLLEFRDFGYTRISLVLMRPAMPRKDFYQSVNYSIRVAALLSDLILTHW